MPEMRNKSMRRLRISSGYKLFSMCGAGLAKEPVAGKIPVTL